jgi:DNA-binding transcriptional regulator YdaS (Cro superfamily)
MNGLDVAIERAGGVSKLAALLGLHQTVVSNWRSRGIPAKRCPEVERVTGVPRWVLLPDLFLPDAPINRITEHG